ncbi:hypothetical protein HK098_002389 [Nowakowskiella sp. JEL0407]|nr:hypothetical protein HK098_002389 [Nowakowskiella sp. JEL0407]
MSDEEKPVIDEIVEKLSTEETPEPTNAISELTSESNVVTTTPELKPQPPSVPSVSEVEAIKIQALWRGHRVRRSSQIVVGDDKSNSLKISMKQELEGEVVEEENTQSTVQEPPNVNTNEIQETVIKNEATVNSLNSNDKSIKAESNVEETAINELEKWEKMDISNTEVIEPIDDGKDQIVEFQVLNPNQYSKPDDQYAPDEPRATFQTWFNKPYLGGFRSNKTAVEYFHAATQTTTAHDIRDMKAKPKFHRDTQTKFLRNRNNQTKRDSYTQMLNKNSYISSEYDYVLQPRRYLTADELEKIKHNMKEKRRKELADKKRKKDIESRLHPQTNKDFEVLYNGLESWRQQQTDIINNSGYSEPARLAALANLLDQESALIQKIDRLKIAANEENREKSIVALLEQMSSPKRWPVSKPPGSFTLVDTPNTIRAKELRDLYHALNIPLLSVDERLQILLHVKYTVKVGLKELIDREGDLFPDAGQSWKKNNAVYYCRGCTKYLPSTRFYLSTTIRQLGKCKACMLKENVATQRKDDSCYMDMLQLVRMQERQKRQLQLSSNTDGDTDSGKYVNYNQRDASGSDEFSMALMQESDMRYLVDIIWNRQSAISANRNISELVFTRWDANVELSPWNCVLLTRTEALTHDKASIAGTSIHSLYSEEFVSRINQKHMSAKQHFSQLPAMESHMKKSHTESQVVTN